MLMHLCPRCKKVIPAGVGYCEQCAALLEKQREVRQRKRPRTPAKRTQQDPKYMQFYNSTAWRMLSKSTMAKRGYLCEECKRHYIITLASDVHHIIPIQSPEGWARRLDPTNLICLCIDCHNAAHKRFKSR